METLTVVKVALGAVIIAGIFFGNYVDRKNKALLEKNQNWLKR